MALNDPVADDEYSLTFTGLNNAYQDLFYETIEVEFEILSETSITPGTYERLLI